LYFETKFQSTVAQNGH